MPVSRLGNANIFENIVAGIPRIATAMEDLPVEQLWSVLDAVEASYLRSLRQSDFSESACRAVTSAVMRRLKGQLGGDDLSEKEMMRKLCKELGLVGIIAAA
jgi:hypothetical protein